MRRLKSYGITDPLIADFFAGIVPRHIHQPIELFPLWFVFVVHDKDAELGRVFDPGLLRLPRGILLEFAQGVVERRSGIVHLVDNQDAFADETRATEGREIEPLDPLDLCPDLLFDPRAQVFIENQTDGLDRDILLPVNLEERPQDTSGYEPTPTDGNDQIRPEFSQYAITGILAQRVDLVIRDVDLFDFRHPAEMLPRNFCWGQSQNICQTEMSTVKGELYMTPWPWQIGTPGKCEMGNSFQRDKKSK